MAESASPNSFNFFQAMTNPQFAASQLQIQRQQALAQQLMDQGSEQPPTAQLANPGGLVVPNSPVAALARALEKGAGGYMQGKALADQMQSYKDLYNTQHPILPQAQNAILQGQDGPPTTEQMEMARQLSDQIRMQSLSKGAPQPMYMDPAFMQNASMVGVDNATKEYIDRTKPTDQMKNANSGNPLVTNPMVKEGLIPGGQNYLNPPSSNGQPAPASNMTPEQAKGIVDVYGGEAPNSAPTTNVMPNPVPGVTPGYDRNSSAAIKGAEAAASKAGENIAATNKSAAEAGEGYKQVEKTIESLKTLINNPDLPQSKYGVPAEKQAWMSQNFPQIDKQKAANAYNTFSTINESQTINAIRDLASTGQIRMTRTLENIINRGYLIDPDASPDAKMAQANAIETELRNSATGASNIAAKLSGNPNATPYGSPVPPSSATPIPVQESSPKIIKYNAQGQRVQ